MNLARRLRLLIALAGLGGALASCRQLGHVGHVQAIGGLADATALAWAYYGRIDPPPRVRVAQGDDLACEDPSSHKPGFEVILSSGLSCREGFTITPLEVTVSWHGEPWHETALAHELQHVRQWRALHVVDPGHLRMEWATDVPAANALLQARGL